MFALLKYRQLLLFLIPELSDWKINEKHIYINYKHKTIKPVRLSCDIFNNAKILSSKLNMPPLWLRNTRTKLIHLKS